MTRFASKYGLYLYREKGVDISDQPTGVPVLFIPGHAGSYKQVRSIAAESAFYYYRYYANDPEKQQQGIRNLDFFTVDFHEEFSALHGQSLLEQAEYLNDAIDYILKLYPHTTTSQRPDPTSVIVIGHSMGGIVARTMFTMDNYQHGTINTIITMSTPHMLPPAPFDWKISELYDDINQFWQSGFTTNTTARRTSNRHYQPLPAHISLRDISIVSMAGGTLDNTVCSDSTNLGSIVPATHGFTVFSTAVPHVWTAADHVSILTCNQLVKVVAKTLLDLVDVGRGSQTKPLEERMTIMRGAFLNGLEDRTPLEHGNLTYFPLDSCTFLEPGERWLTTTLADEPRPQMVLLPTVANAEAFAVLSDDIHGRFELMLCSKAETAVACRSIQPVMVPVPASTKAIQHPFEGPSFVFGSLDFQEMGSFSWLAIRDHATTSPGFLIVEPFMKAVNHQTIHQSMVSIAFEGVHAKMSPTLFSTLRIPAIESPILAYHLKVSRRPCPQQQQLFSPFLRQSISTMHESKFYVNLADNPEAETDLSIHGRTAFTSMVSTKDATGLSLQVWMDPSCPEPLELQLSIDWYGSLGRLGFRNGIMLATFSFVMVMLVFVTQLQCYDAMGLYPHFGQAMAYCGRRTLWVVIALLAIGSVLQCRDDWALWEDVLSGNTDVFFWWVPVAGLVLSAGMVSLLWLLVECVVRLVCRVEVVVMPHVRWCRRREASKQEQLQRRLVTTVILFLLVATVIPYQFVFIVAFLVQIVTCVRAYTKCKSGHVNELKRTNRYNYMISILLLMFTLLPFNLPILLVWIRNISVHWFVPFSSDHSVMAIAPFMIYVEILTSQRKMLPRQKNRYILVKRRSL
ncbi:MAG: PGAP1-like protein-domain-containing protein [Benjaminiella poitrasii]|nr:MAG: PGAP1-like protein-domain-containing protein [Benjaminiella poitrasii]